LEIDSGIEVDFIINHDVAIEAKATAHVTSDHLKNLRHLKTEYKEIKKKNSGLFRKTKTSY